MRLKVGKLTIELAPLTKEVMGEFISLEHGGGMQRLEVRRYTSSITAPVLEDEHDWFEKTRQSKDSIVWGIWLIEDDRRILIGNTSLFSFDEGHTKLIQQATSGSMIFRKEYWGKGIASSIHKARTWFAFQHLGLHRVKSAVIQGNGGSLKALSRSGYSLVYVERNEQFINGQLRHLDCLECLSPSESFWNQWWHGDRPPKRALEARKCTQEALVWAEENVELL
jgi:RimJ/RimL family protein N-acetyltransferase